MRDSCVWHLMCQMGLATLLWRTVELCVHSLGKLIQFCRIKLNCLVLLCVESNLCARQCQVNYCGSWDVCGAFVDCGEPARSRKGYGSSLHLCEIAK